MLYKYCLICSWGQVLQYYMVRVKIINFWPPVNFLLPIPTYQPLPSRAFFGTLVPHILFLSFSPRRFGLFPRVIHYANRVMGF